MTRYRALAILVIMCPAIALLPTAPTPAAQPADQWKTTVDKAAAYLKKSQNEDGSWSASPQNRGITGVVVYAALALAEAGYGLRVRQLSLRTPTLDDVFLSVTGARLADRDAAFMWQAAATVHRLAILGQLKAQAEIRICDHPIRSSTLYRWATAIPFVWRVGQSTWSATGIGPMTPKT